MPKSGFNTPYNVDLINLKYKLLHETKEGFFKKKLKKQYSLVPKQIHQHK